MKLRKIQTQNLDTDEISPAAQLICGCGCEHFIVYTFGKGHSHMQCAECNKVNCSKHPEPLTEEEPSFDSEWDSDD